MPPTHTPIFTTDPLGVPPTGSFAFRLPTHTFPNESVAVRDGFFPSPSGAVEYSPRIWPLVPSIRTSVPRPEAAMFTIGKGSGLPATFNCSWSGTTVALTLKAAPSWKSDVVV